MDRRIALSSLLFAAANLLGDERKEASNTKVAGPMAIPEDLKSFEKRALELRLYEYDPRVADQAANLRPVK